jgi:hypothetical protein
MIDLCRIISCDGTASSQIWEEVDRMLLKSTFDREVDHPLTLHRSLIPLLQSVRYGMAAMQALNPFLSCHMQPHHNLTCRYTSCRHRSSISYLHILRMIAKRGKKD